MKETKKGCYGKAFKDVPYVENTIWRSFSLANAVVFRIEYKVCIIQQQITTAAAYTDVALLLRAGNFPLP